MDELNCFVSEMIKSNLYRDLHNLIMKISEQKERSDKAQGHGSHGIKIGAL